MPVAPRKRSAKSAVKRDTKKKTAAPEKKAAAPKKKTAALKKKTATPKKKTATPKKKTAAPKVSPMRGLSVGAYVDGLAGWQADAVRELCGLVTRLAPTATCAIKWGQVVFELGGPFAFVKPARAHLTFGFWRGTQLDDPSGVLEGSGTMMRHVKIGGIDHLASLPLQSFVLQAVALNATHGNPTRR